MPGPRDGFHCDRERLVWTNTVSGLPLLIVQMPDRCHPSSSAPVAPDRPLANGNSHVKFRTQLCRVSKSEGPRLYSGMNSGSADVVPLVASEKNVEACVVSTLFENVYDDCIENPSAQRRRTSRMSALYHESPSLLLSSIVEKAGLIRGVPAAMNGWPSAVVPVGCARFTSPLRHRCAPRDPAYPAVTAVFHPSSRWTLTL